MHCVIRFISFQTFRAIDVGIKTIDKNALRGLHRLRHLSLALNKLRNAPPLTYVRSSLENLDLRGNRICEIPSNHFANCSKLQYLNLWSNCLNEVPHLSHISRTIQHIDLYGNSITSAEALFEHMLPSLLNLDMGDNLLSFWCFPPRSFWPNLQYLNLECQYLSFLTEPFNYGRISVLLGQHNLSCSTHLNWMRQCRAGMHPIFGTPMLTCGDHNETVLTDVTFPCPGAQGRMEIVYPWAFYQICKIAGWACVGNAGNLFPATDYKGKRWLTIPACITARAWRTCCDACRDR